MSRRAWAYICGVYLAAFALAAVTLQNGLTPPTSTELITFVLLTTLATVSQLFEVEYGKQSFYPHFVFFMAGVMLLQPFLFVLLVTIPHLVEWTKEYLTEKENARAWYIQPFNISGHVIAGTAALMIYRALLANPVPDPMLLALIAAISAAVTYVAVNHVLIGMALVLARGLTWRQSGILEIESILPDMVLSLLGYTVAVLWEINFWLVLPALAPLVMMYKAMMVPQLRQEAQTDSKTGLWNARHFATLFQAEMERARRFDRPLTMIMADLDLLRNVNNPYGHLAGDTVLSGIGLIVRQTIREYDIAGRFGGEEFAIVLPETSPAEARVLAERIRAAVEAHSFKITTSPTPIKCTMSLGVACFPEDAAETEPLVHCADVAVYQAKLKGRNCVVFASDVPHSVKLESKPMPMEDRLPSAYGAAHLSKGGDPVVASEPHVAEDKTYTTSKLGMEMANGHSTSGRLSHDPALSTQMAVQVAEISTESQIPQLPPEDAAGIFKSEENTSLQLSKEQLQADSTSPKSQRMLKFYVATVIGCAFLAIIIRMSMGGNIDPGAIALFVGLAVIAELLQVDLYGPGTVSVSVAVMMATALVTGVPGIACASAAIAAVHYARRRPELYKSAFNWATHVLASLAPIMDVNLLQVGLKVDALLMLALPITVASAVYYGVETGLIAGAISLSSGGKWIETWRERYRWLFNHYLVLSIMGLFLAIAYTGQGPTGLLVFTLPVFMMHYTQRQYVDRTEDSVRELQRMNTELTRANMEVVVANKAMQALNDDLFLTLSKIIDARDPYVSGHASKVADYATAIGIELGLPAWRMEPLRQAGFLHDIGKIAISEQVLHKPSRLTRDEYEYIKTHAALGAEFLELSGGLRHLAPFVRHHHEYWDGHGYPDGLYGEQIELEARILSVCDAAEAMASDRPYRKGMSLDETIAEIKRCAGTQFDPAVAEAFTRVAEREREQLVVNSAKEVLRKHKDEAGFFGTTGVDGRPLGVSTGPLSMAQAS